MAAMWITRLGIVSDDGSATKIGGGGGGGTDGHAEQQNIMDEVGVWESLPEDVLDRVLARLPLQSLLRMQCVCKRWKIKLRTSSFIRLCESESDVVPQKWFLTFGNVPGPVGLAYDCHLCKWHSLPLGFLPFALDNKSPLAAADGLICLGAGWRSLNKGFTPTRLVVCNPLSRFWRDVALPPDLDPATSLVSVAGIVVDRYAGTYKLVIVGEVTKQEGGGKREQKVLIAFVFDSVSQSWSSHETLVNFLDPFTSFLTSHFRTLVGFAIRSVCCSVVCEGVMYCLTSRPYQLHAFHVESEEWSRSRVALPAEIRGPSLAGRPGHLFLVGAYLHNQHDKSSNIGIWELDQETLRWSVVDILLEATLCNHGRSKSPACPGTAQRPNPNPEGCEEDVILFVKWSVRFLAYNVTKKSWHWLPDFHLCSQSCAPSSTGYLFAPSLLLP
jgi:hypothetical protein